MMRALVSGLLRLFPGSFRQTFGEDLAATFEDRWRECGGWRVAMRTIADMIHSAALEHLAEFRRGGHNFAAQSGTRRGDSGMIALSQDVRFAIRMLRRNPGFTAVVAAVLAIGIGANSAIFSLVDATLLRPPPFAHPRDLVMLWEHPPGYAHNRVSPLNFLDWSEQNQAFSSMAAVSGASRTLVGASGAELIPGQSVSAAFFDLLGVKPIAGRTFTSDDARQHADVILLSEELWKSHFGGDPTVIGRTVQFDRGFTVVGIIPAGFQIFYKADLWTLFVPERSPQQRRMHYLQVLGRLKPGVTLERAIADMGLVAANIARISPATNKDWGVTIERLRDALVDRDLRVTSLVLAGVVGFVLLMACANVANLLLARGVGRAREIAVRSSLGGSRGRILGQLLTESALLAALGGAAGTAFAWIILKTAPSFLPPGLLPVSMRLGLDGRVIGFSAALTAATGLLFGLAPAWHAARISLADTLRAGGRTATSGMGTFRGFLATGEIAVAVLLMAGAGLLVRTLVSLDRVDPGYHATNVLTMSVSLPISRYPKPENALAFYQAAEKEIASLPGVREVAVGGRLPLDGWDIGQGFAIVGQPSDGEAAAPSAHYQMVGASYFDTLGIRLLRGRAFTERDTASTTPVCIVNEELVRRYLQGKDPLGALVKVQAMMPAGPTPVVRQIVGVIRQVKVEGPGEKQSALEIYVPVAQNPWYWASIAVRTAADPMSLAPAVRAAMARVDKDQPVTHVRTMEQVAAESVAEPRFRAQLVGTFGALAMILAAVGIFGVLAFSVGQRTREFGIRMALGAGAGDVLRLVLTGGLKMISAGIAIGLAAALLLTRFLATLLFGVQPLDPITFVAAGALLGLVALAACAAPAVKAARVDPAVALHHE